jgi:7-carboxy-7-deazaguanine synthase
MQSKDYSVEKPETFIGQDRLSDPMSIRIPLVEIFETVEGEGTRAGFPTTFVRLYGCNLRCTWCDTKYSYAPYKPEMTFSIGEIIDRVEGFGARHICMTGGEPLLYGPKSLELAIALADLPTIDDVHIETNGAIDLTPFVRQISNPKVRYIMDFKLPASGEMDKMVIGNLALLRPQDELKFVIGSEEDFHIARELLEKHPTKALPLFSPVWETMPPARLVDLMLEHRLSRVKLNMQLHKVIWDPNQRGV